MSQEETKAGSELSAEVRANPFTGRRFGMFAISGEVLRQHGEEVQKFFCNLLIVRAEHHWDSDQIEYTSCGMEFDPVAEGSRAPRYDVRVTKHEDGRLTYKFERREP